MSSQHGDKLRIGNYFLGQRVEDAPSLSEFSEDQYRQFALVGIVKQFPDEKFFKAENTKYGDLDDWQVVIGSAEGRIYKIQLLANTDNFDSARGFKKSNVKLLNTKLGKYKKHANMFNTFIWDTYFGNVVLTLAKVESIYFITLTFTSNLISKLVS